MKKEQILEHLAHSFLAQKSIAVIGVSDKRETGCNLDALLVGLSPVFGGTVSIIIYCN